MAPPVETHLLQQTVYLQVDLSARSLRGETTLRVGVKPAQRK